MAFGYASRTTSTSSLIDTAADRSGRSASGNVSLGDHIISVGAPLAGQGSTLRLDGPVAHVLSGGVLTRTVTCPVPELARSRLRGARPGQQTAPRLPEPQAVRRRASVRGAIMIGRQRIRVGLPHGGKTAVISIMRDTYQITVDDELTFTARRSGSGDIRRHKASHYPARQSGDHRP
jgi:hypothetical protein